MRPHVTSGIGSGTKSVRVRDTRGVSETLNSTPTAPESQPLVELEVGPVAHGGHCVARLDGRVVFVRHALPGERVLARLTEEGDTAKFWRADAIEIDRKSTRLNSSHWE